MGAVGSPACPPGMVGLVGRVPAASVPVALLTALASSTIVLASPQAGASPPASARSLERDLLPRTYIQRAGFTSVVEQPVSTSHTGERSCPNGAEEAFEDRTGKTGILVELVACTTAAHAATLLESVKAKTAAVPVAPPERLGGSAFERSSKGDVYTIYWRRGRTLALVGLATDVAASGSTSAPTSVSAPPITAAQQHLLAGVALVQDARLKRR